MCEVCATAFGHFPGCPAVDDYYDDECDEDDCDETEKDKWMDNWGVNMSEEDYGNEDHPAFWT